jgi:hypothetical protein
VTVPIEKSTERRPRALTRDELEALIADRNARFTGLTPAEQRIAIAKDVLNQLKQRKLRANAGRYLAYAGVDHDSAKEHELMLRPAQEALDNLPTCKVCALGAAFVVAGQLFDQLPDERAGVVLGCATDGGCEDGYLNRFFSQEQLGMIEAAFERDRSHYNRRMAVVHRMVEDGSWYDQRATDARDFGLRYDLDGNRMRAIFLNIVGNEGTFRPNPLATYFLDVEPQAQADYT